MMGGYESLSHMVAPDSDPAAIYACDRSVYIHLSKTLLDQILEINHALNNGIVDRLHNTDCASLA